MSIEYGANIYAGYELRDGWEDIVPQEFIDEHEDMFVHLNMFDGEVLLFAIDIDSVECGDFTELCLDISDDERGILNEFSANYPKAVFNKRPKYYLAGKIY